MATPRKPDALPRGHRKVSATDRHGKDYTTEEFNAIFRRIYPMNPKALVLLFPEMDLKMIINRAKYLKIANKPRWKADEDSVLMELWPDRRAISKRLKRTVRSIIDRRAKLVKRPITGPFYTEEENAIVRAGGTPPGRSKRSAAAVRKYRGIKLKHIKAVAELGPKALTDRVAGLISRSYPPHIRNEAIAMVVARCFEGTLSPEIESLTIAARKAVTATYKLHPDRGAPTSLDAQIFDDSGTTFGDRIASDAFHF